MERLTTEQTAVITFWLYQKGLQGVMDEFVHKYCCEKEPTSEEIDEALKKEGFVFDEHGDLIK